MSTSTTAATETIRREVDLPPVTVLDRLALSDKGFVFDPVTGNSFTANATGLCLIKLFQRERDLSELVAQVTSEFDLTDADAERDILDFASLLRGTLRP